MKSNIGIATGPSAAKSTLDRSNFPSHFDPEKGFEWHLHSVKAAWLEYRSLQAGSLYFARDRYAAIESYVQGTYSIDKFKSQIEIGEKNSDAWVSLDWTPVQWMKAPIDMALAKISKRDYAVSCSPIDTLSKAEREEALAAIEARLMIRQEMERAQPGSSNGTPFEKEPSEPEDMAEMEMLRKYTWKHNLAMQAEQVIDVTLNSNKYNEVRKNLKKDLIKFGACGTKEWIDSAGNVKVRRVKPHNAVVAPAELDTYEDVRYAGEVRRMLVSELMEEAGDQFSHEEYVNIAKHFINRLGNPSPLAEEDLYQNFQDYKVEVLDLEWRSIDEYVWESRVNKYGNVISGWTSKEKIKESPERSYTRKTFEVFYEGSWIIGSDYLYNWGLQTNMKRKRTSMQRTSGKFHFRAIDFFYGKLTSPAEALIPFSDQLQLLWMKYQFVVAKIRADGIAVEMGALEDIAVGDGGKNLDPIEVLDLWHQSATLYYRRLNMAGEPVHYDPIRELKTDNARKLQSIWSEIQNVMAVMKQRIGFNDLTDGTSYDPRALKSAVAAADESTNNALWKIISAERHLFEDVCESVLLRAQTVLRMGGNVEGYTTALGNDTRAFFAASPDLSYRDFGLVLFDVPTMEEKERLIQEAKEFAGADLVTMEDVFTIKTARNLKQAEMILSIKIEQRRKKRQQEEMERMQQNGQIQQQSAIVAEEQKRATLQLEHQLKMQLQEHGKTWDMRIEQLKAETEISTAEIGSQASLLRLGIATESQEEQVRMKEGTNKIVDNKKESNGSEEN